MYPYKFSVIRFSPVPARGELFNLGIVVGSDSRGDWTIDSIVPKGVGPFDEDSLLPHATAEVTRVTSLIDNSQLEFFDDEEFEFPSEEWLEEMHQISQNIIQYSEPSIVIASSAAEALEVLRPLYLPVFEKRHRASLTRRVVKNRYWALLRSQLGEQYAKRDSTLKVNKQEATLDIVVHNGRATEVTQCLSLQVKEPQSVMQSARAWAGLLSLQAGRRSSKLKRM